MWDMAVCSDVNVCVCPSMIQFVDASVNVVPSVCQQQHWSINFQLSIYSMHGPNYNINIIKYSVVFGNLSPMNNYRKMVFGDKIG